MSNHGHLWYGSERNDRKIQGLNDDLIHTTLSILISDLDDIEKSKADPRPLATAPEEADLDDFVYDEDEWSGILATIASDPFWHGTFSLADMLWVLTENDSDDTRMLACKIADVTYTKPMVESGSISFISAGIIRVIEERIRGDGTALYRTTEKNPFERNSPAAATWEAITDGTYWTQALLMGIQVSSINRMVNAGLLVARHKAVDSDAPKRRNRRSHGVAVNLRPHAPPP